MLAIPYFNRRARIVPNPYHIYNNISAIVTRDGRDRHIRWFDAALQDGNGKVIHLLKIGYDVANFRQVKEDWKYTQEWMAGLERKHREHEG
jgi:hypothetical protein